MSHDTDPQLRALIRQACEPSSLAAGDVTRSAELKEQITAKLAKASRPLPINRAPRFIVAALAVAACVVVAVLLHQREQTPLISQREPSAQGDGPIVVITEVEEETSITLAPELFPAERRENEAETSESVHGFVQDSLIIPREVELSPKAEASQYRERQSRARIRGRGAATIDSSSQGVIGGTGLQGHGAAARGQFQLPESGEQGSDGATMYGYTRSDDGIKGLSALPAYLAGPGREQYRSPEDNPFHTVKGVEAVSTFSIDVDTASYAKMRRILMQGQRPPRDAVRVEELLNYFTYEYPQPQGEHPFSVNLETAPCPWQPEHKLLRVGLKGKEVPRPERPVSNLVFLVDVSGSMADLDKLPLLKQALHMLVRELLPSDRVTLVTYAGNSGVRLEPTSAENRQAIDAAIDALESGGSTNGSAGIQLAYEKAREHFVKEGSNRVLLCTDGDLNVGITSDEELVSLITREAKSGVFLTVLGFGRGNLQDAKLEGLADHGNGVYAYIDGIREARKVLVEQASGSLITIAKDVKLQLEFNPAQVQSYRLIGYENRLLARKDFNDDTKDAGEIGAGHTVTALYELVLTHGKIGDEVTPLKYQPLENAVDNKNAAPPANEQAESAQVASDKATSQELLTMQLRYKRPNEEKSILMETTLSKQGQRFAEASTDFRFAAAVAAFGMALRNSPHRGDLSVAGITEIAASSVGTDAQGYRAEFIDLLRRAQLMGIR